MAATNGLSREQQDRVRASIKTTQLVKRLQCFALGVPDDAGNPVDLDANRIKAIETLIKKTVPDLKAIEITGAEADGSIGVVFKTIYETRG